MKRRSLVIIVVILLALTAGAVAYYKEDTPETTNKPANQTTSKPSTPQQPAFDKKQFSLENPDSLWIIANKQRPLNPKNYAPTLVIPAMRLRSNITTDERQVRQVTADALEKLSTAAEADGITLTLESGYRSYNFQVNLYDHYVSVQGKAVADTQSARPGYSEHQTGLAADLGGVTKPACNVEDCFKDTPEGEWIVANAYKYGFIIRYPEGKQAVTGYIYEPWHLRYVGTDLAQEMRRVNVSTLEEFFGLGPAGDYN